jgi:hypothetical protein
MRPLVARVHRDEAWALTMDGQQLPITDWVDRDGVVGCEPDEAAFCVAGPDAHGKWWTIDCRRLERVTLQ